MFCACLEHAFIISNLQISNNDHSLQYPIIMNPDIAHIECQNSLKHEMQMLLAHITTGRNDF